MNNIRKRALQKTEMEGRKCVRIMLAAVCIALRRGWRFGTNRLHDLLLETQSIWVPIPSTKGLRSQLKV